MFLAKWNVMILTSACCKDDLVVFALYDLVANQLVGCDDSVASLLQGRVGRFYTLCVGATRWRAAATTSTARSGGARGAEGEKISSRGHRRDTLSHSPFEDERY